MKHRILVIVFLLFVFACTQVKQVEKIASDSKPLTKAFIHAVNAIRSSQSEEGFWKTFHTRDSSFINPRQEVNSWTPMILVDILDPVVNETSLQEELERARGFVQTMIEPNGFLLYNLTDRLLPPDSDGASLAWRIAPLENLNLAENVLDTLKQYRNEDGFYYIWFKPGGIPEHPAIGDDPNPIDIGAQFHVYLFLKIYAPEMADDLCQAIQKHINNPGLRPYYRLAPWILILREIDLHNAGCPLVKTDVMLDSYLTNQELYLKLVELMRDLMLGNPSTKLRADIHQVLTELAKDDFGVIGQKPMFIYHNDLTSQVSRYYWSKDIVYALWLRLYVEASQRFENWYLPE